METIDLETIKNWGPISENEEKRIAALFVGRETLTAAEVVKSADRPGSALWLLLRKHWLDERALRLLAVEFAVLMLAREQDAGRKPDPRTVNACAVAVKFAHGEASVEELDAARNAASIVSLSEWNAVRNGRGGVDSGVAAAAAVWATARDAETGAWANWNNSPGNILTAEVLATAIEALMPKNPPLKMVGQAVYLDDVKPGEKIPIIWTEAEN